MRHSLRMNLENGGGIEAPRFQARPLLTKGMEWRWFYRLNRTRR
jgi:hypothetical protein